MQGRQGFLQVVHHGDGVFILRFLHIEQQGALSVVECQAINFLRTVRHPSHLVNPDRRTVLARHNDLAEIFGALHAGVNLDDALLLIGVDGAHWHLLIFITHGRCHLLGRNTKCLQCLRVEVDIDFALGAPTNVTEPTPRTFSSLFLRT